MFIWDFWLFLLLLFFSDEKWHQDKIVRRLYNHGARLEIEEGDTLEHILDDLRALKEKGPRYEYVLTTLVNKLGEKGSEAENFTQSEERIVSEIFDVATAVLNKDLTHLINTLEKEYKNAATISNGYEADVENNDFREEMYLQRRI